MSKALAAGRGWVVGLLTFGWKGRGRGSENGETPDLRSPEVGVSALQARIRG